MKPEETKIEITFGRRGVEVVEIRATRQTQNQGFEIVRQLQPAIDEFESKYLEILDAQEGSYEKI